MPSMTPIAFWYLAIPLSGFLIIIFTIEQIVNGLINGYDYVEQPPEQLDLYELESQEVKL